MILDEFLRRDAERSGGEFVPSRPTPASAHTEIKAVNRPFVTCGKLAVI